LKADEKAILSLQGYKMPHQEMTRNEFHEKPEESFSGRRDLDLISKDQAMPLVSIIVVNWNGLKHIDECLKSLLNQIYSNMEIILVDNCSEDGSVELIASLNQNTVAEKNWLNKLVEVILRLGRYCRSIRKNLLFR